LYFGLMITKNGPKVIEYNCRFGDPEAQVVLPLLQSDLLSIMLATENGTLAETDVTFSDGAACCVVMASKGYPQKYETGFAITTEDNMTAEVIYAGAKNKDGQIVTGGGRVLCVVAQAETLPLAIEKSYENVQKVHFENAYYRKDIGKRALTVLTERGDN